MADSPDRSEIWVKINGFPNYEISNIGNIRNAKTKKIRAIHLKGEYGHAQVSLYKDGSNKRFQVHRLVAIHFIPNPQNKPEVCHIDNTLDENGFLNNSARNLIWGTHEENCQFENTRKRQSENHADVSGQKNPNFGKHLSREHKEKMMKAHGKQVIQWSNGRIIAFYESLKDAGRKTGIHWTNIRNVCDGKYKHAGSYEWSYARKNYDLEEVVKQFEEMKPDIECFDNEADYEYVLNRHHKYVQIVRRGGVK